MVRYAISAGEYGFPSRGTASLLDQIHRLAAAGVEFLQLREKHLGAGELAALTREILAILAASGAPTRLLISARADVAVATRAHGVHLTSACGGLTAGQIRDLYRMRGLPKPVVSRACHTHSEVLAARNESTDLILFSPVFGKGEMPGTGLPALQEACAVAAYVPVLALGGVTAANASSCLTAGAAGVAGIRLFQGDDFVPTTTRRMP
ncbi:thiamine-phosphate pyrophosphorylase [Granulicella pectinivorans]|uniref:Thiamine-phosphate pyrophosphorylase n=1 Tax=Granulicella pectinivorans TaxID=474950 RepID=A0A1I6LPJ3_9BACT|nr:thiamine phosphate synthase [Granulicella pectinivorans]SFS05353.1 thiamine-phosphate pyrophosphorylase [Granulicella pectinivorans]